MQQSRAESGGASTSVGGGTVGLSVAASASMSSATSSGVATFHSTAGHSKIEDEDSRAMFQTYVRASYHMTNRCAAMACVNFFLWIGEAVITGVCFGCVIPDMWDKLVVGPRARDRPVK